MLRLALAVAAFAGSLVFQSPSGHTVTWSEGAPFADRVIYNGQRYETIEIPGQIYLSVSFDENRYFTLANVIVRNLGRERIDVEPERFTCACLQSKPKILKYKWPFGLPSDPKVPALKANTVVPGDTLKGIVSFEKVRNCNPALVAIPIGGVTYQFPFSNKT